MDWKCLGCNALMEQQVLLAVELSVNPLAGGGKVFSCLCRQCRQRVAIILGQESNIFDTKEEAQK